VWVPSPPPALTCSHLDKEGRAARRGAWALLVGSWADTSATAAGCGGEAIRRGREPARRRSDDPTDLPPPPRRRNAMPPTPFPISQPNFHNIGLQKVVIVLIIIPQSKYGGKHFDAAKITN